MKNYLIPALTLALLAVSCEKEKVDNQQNNNVETASSLIEVRCNIDNTDVKTSYDISGNTAFFHWTGTETIGRLWYTSAPQFGHDAFTSTTSADNKETSLVFRGYDSPNQTAYAMYPIWNGNDKTGIGWSSNPFRLYLNESMAYNSSDPLKNVVPMIAKLSDSGEFDFVPVTGIIAVTVKNLPSTANKITVSSAGAAMSGNYLLTSNPSNYATNIEWVMANGLTTKIASNGGNTTGTKSFTFSGLDKGEHVFYFPVSVGTYNGITITIYSGSTALQTVSTTKSVSVAKGEIVAFPVMDLAKATKVMITGDANEAYIYVDSFGPDAHVKFAVASSEATAISGVSSGTAITAAGESNKVLIFDGLTASGQYYLAYSVFDSSNNVLISEVNPIYFINDSDAAQLAGNYNFSAVYGLTHYDRSAWKDITSSEWGNNLTLAVSENPRIGNVQITNVFGFGSDGSYQEKIVTGPFANSSNVTDLYGSKFSAGAPTIGVFTNNVLRFEESSQSPFMNYAISPITEKTTDKIYVRDSYNDYFEFNVNLNSPVTLTKTTTNNIILHFDGASNKNGDCCVLTLRGYGANQQAAPLTAIKQ